MTSLKSGITSVQDLIAKAKAGADLNYGSSGNGSASHLAVEMLKSAAGIKLTHVPFKGNADAQLALQSGDIQLLSDAIPGAVGPVQVRQGERRSASPTSAARPSCPTCRPSPSRASRASSPSAGSASRPPPRRPSRSSTS